MVGPPEEGGMIEARNAQDNIIISGSTLRNILPPQLNNMTARYKLMCGCKCYISSQSMNSFLLTWRDLHFKHLKYRSHNAQNKRSG